MEAIYHKDHDVFEFTAAADLDSGEIVQVAGRAGVVTGLKGFKSGELAAARVRGQFFVAVASATTFAAGAEVEWDNTNKVAVAGTAGDFDLGRAVKAKAAGETTVLVSLNDL